jgi:N-acyl-L-homoserine lactone synthetase
MVRNELIADGSFSVTPAYGAQDLNELDRLWRSVYSDELRWIRSTSEISVFDDEFHEDAVYFAARVLGQAVGLMRILYRRERGLPAERFVSLDGLIREPDATVIECQRLIVSKEFRPYRSPAAPFGIWPALMKATMQFSLINSVGYMIADCFLDTDTTPIKSLKSIGFRETGIVFTDTELADVSSSTILLLDVRDMVRICFRRYSPLNAYLVSHDTCLRFSTPTSNAISRSSKRPEATIDSGRFAVAAS